EDYEIWEPKLPKDYKEITQMSKCPEMYSTIKKEELYNTFSKGILLQQDKVYMIEIVPNIGTFPLVKRFDTVVEMFDISRLNIEIKTTVQLLSPNVVYGIYLVFKHSDSRQVSSKPMYVNLKYTNGLENLHAYFATWRDKDWMMIELCQFLNQNKDVIFEFLLESFSSYYCGDGAVYVEGIEFRAIDEVKHKEIGKLKEVQQVLHSNFNMDQVQQLPTNFEEIFKICRNYDELFWLGEVNEKKLLVLSAKAVLYKFSNVDFFVSKALAESRFQEVIELLPQEVFHLNCMIKSQMLSQDTEYVSYLVFKLSEKCQGLHCPVKLRDVLHKENNGVEFVYFTTPSALNINGNTRVPKQREDGWMEIQMWKFNSTHEFKDGSLSVDIKFTSHEGTIIGKMICETWMVIKSCKSEVCAGAIYGPECTKLVASRDKVVNITARDSVEASVEDRIMNSGALFHATYCKEELERFKLRFDKKVVALHLLHQSEDLATMILLSKTAVGVAVEEEWRRKDTSLAHLKVFSYDTFVKVKDICGEAMKCTFIGSGSFEMRYSFRIRIVTRLSEVEILHLWTQFIKPGSEYLKFDSFMQKDKVKGPYLFEDSWNEEPYNDVHQRVLYVRWYRQVRAMVLLKGRDSSWLFLSQKKYDVEILERAHMVSCNPSRTLVETESKLGDVGAPVYDPSLYQSLMGSLQYLTFTRPDIYYVLQNVCLTFTVEEINTCKVQDYALWDVMKNGNLFKPVAQKITNDAGTLTTHLLGHVTTEAKAQKKNDVKARSMLLMALPNEHLITFNQYGDAKTLFAAIKTRFGGNEATKTTQKTFLKKLYKNFSATSTENKSDLDIMRIDDLYSNFKIVEQEVKGTACSDLSSQNIAFMTSPSTNSTNEVPTAYEVSTASTRSSTASTKVSTDNLSDATVYAFLSNQSNGSQLVHEDLEQIHKDDLEEMDLKWQLASLGMRAKRFFQKTRKKITINRSDTAGFDKSKVECYNFHKMGHFSRECRQPRNQDSDSLNQDSSKRTVNLKETPPKAMVAIYGVGFN
nr:protein kinase-like domain, phloem protein 2-like protein [Tanacetum cinerariifolium]